MARMLNKYHKKLPLFIIAIWGVAISLIGCSEGSSENKRFKLTLSTDEGDNGVIDYVSYLYLNTNIVINNENLLFGIPIEGLDWVETDIDNDGTIDAIGYYIYDSNGNITTIENDKDNDGVIDGIENYYYDSNGYITTIENDRGNDGTINSTTYYNFNNGRLESIKEIEENPEDSTDYYNSIIFYNYDDNGNLESIEEFSEYYYDDNGRLDSIEEIRGNPEYWTNYFNSTTYYYYDDNGNLETSETDTFNEGIIDDITYFNYDSNGNLETIEIDYGNNGSFFITYFSLEKL